MRLLSIVVLINWDVLRSNADVCVNIVGHKDVNKNVVAGIVETAPDKKACLTHCLKLVDAMPCKAVVYAETKPSPSKGQCKLYSSKMRNNLVNVAEPSKNDATYYELLDQCTSQSEKISVDKDSGNVVDILTPTLPTTTISTSATDPNPGPGPELLITPTSIKAPTSTTPPIPAGGGITSGQGSISGPGPGPVTPHVPGGGSYYVPSPQWGPWNDWTTCSVTCGQGRQTRSRKCGGSGCAGNTEDSKQCTLSDQPCTSSQTQTQTQSPPFRPFKPFTQQPPFRPFAPTTPPTGFVPFPKNKG